MTQLVRRLRKGKTENDPTDLSLHIFIAVLTLYRQDTKISVTKSNTKLQNNLLAWRLIKNNGPANLKPNTTVEGNAFATIMIAAEFVCSVHKKAKIII